MRVTARGMLRGVAVETVIAAVLILVGLAGVLLPVIPGLSLIVVGIAVWAIPRGDTLGWSVLGIATAIVVLGSIVKYVLPGQRMRDSGVPMRTIAVGVVLGVIGFFVIPVLGLFLGFVLGVYVAEHARLVDSSLAWPSTRQALLAVGISIIIELGAGLLATAVWIGGLVLAA